MITDEQPTRKGRPLQAPHPDQWIISWIDIGLWFKRTARFRSGSKNPETLACILRRDGVSNLFTFPRPVLVSESRVS